MKLSWGLVSLALAIPSALAQMAPCELEDSYDHDVLSKVVSKDITAIHARDTIFIDLWIHFLVSSPGQANALIDSNGLYRQLAYLNNNYAPWGFQFILKPVSYAMNADWAAGIDNSKAEKMRQLHRGDYKSLNVYLVEGATGGVCSLPIANTNAVGQTDLDGDGCWIPLKSGVNAPDGTMTHEIGHWFGLLHVFQGGCDDGDFCADTPAQASPSNSHMATPGDVNSCPARDSCPAKAGLDNIQNFMDYTDCSSLFTTCQGARMLQMYTSYRANRAIQAGVLWK
jgi:hypothetical protein